MSFQKNRNFLFLFVLIFVVGCSSSSDKDKNTSPKRELSKDYVLVDASSERLPMWMTQKNYHASKEDQRKFKYYVSESEHESKRLCQKSAQARANAKIASEIVLYIKNAYSEASQGGADHEVSECIQESLAQETQSFVVGSQVVHEYWEKRFHKEELGAMYDHQKYHCSTLVRISRENLNQAIRASKQKVLEQLNSDEAKRKAQDALEDIDAKFI